MSNKRLVSSLAAGCLLCGSPALAQHHGGGGGGGAFIGSFLGGATGSAVGNLLTQQPAAPVYVAPPPVYAAPPPVYYQRERVYVPTPSYPQPAWTLQVQARLHDAGYYVGGVDGVYGEGTRRAIINWQTSQGHAPTGYVNADELAMLTGQPAPQAAPLPPTGTPVVVVPVPQQQQQQSTPQQVASNDPFSGVKNGMAYGQARQRLTSAGWSTGFFPSNNNISDSDRDNRAYFVDHHINEVEDCSSSGCAMQFHNNDGRLLYVFTEPGAKNSDAYHGAGPAVIGLCLDMKDMACQNNGQQPR